MVAVAAQMYRRGFITALSGNLSARLPDGNILVTPAGPHKGFLSPEMLIEVSLERGVLSNLGGVQATSELPMHLEVYRKRPDVGAAIHAHPVACIALSLVGITLEKPAIPEAVVLLGEVPTTTYATPSSDENRLAISELIQEHNAIILAHHGTLTVGRDLQEAYYRLETLEHTAQILALAHQLGEPRQLSAEAIRKLTQDRAPR
jgi:L-fuculose-phosphate aldolase